MQDNEVRSLEDILGGPVSEQLQDIHDLLIRLVQPEIAKQGIKLHDFRSFRPESANNFVFTALTEKQELVFLKVAPFHEGIAHAFALYADVGSAGFGRLLQEWAESNPPKDSAEGASYHVMERLSIPSPKVLAASDWYLLRSYLPGVTLAELLEAEDCATAIAPTFDKVLSAIASHVSKLMTYKDLNGPFPSYSVNTSSDGMVLVSDPYGSVPSPFPFAPVDGHVIRQIQNMKLIPSHGDLKPSNIVVNESEVPTFIDPMIRWAPPQSDLGRFIVRLALQMSRRKESFEKLANIFWNSVCDKYDWDGGATSPNDLLEGALFMGLANLHALFSLPSSKYAVLNGKDYQRAVCNRERIMKLFSAGTRLPRTFTDLHGFLHGPV